MLSKYEDLDDSGLPGLSRAAAVAGTTGIADIRRPSQPDRSGVGGKGRSHDLTDPAPGRPGRDSDVLELTAGRRICLELGDDTTVVAQVDRVTDDILDVRLLDELLEPSMSPTVLGVLVVDSKGLFRWPAVALAVDLPDRILVAITGPGTLLQRRRHERIDVDLAATVRRFRGLEMGAGRAARIVDLSRGGLRLVGPVLEIGDVIDVRAETRSGPIHATGRVVLAYPDGKGGSVAHVAFLVPTGSDGLAEVDTYLRSLSGPPEPATAGAGGSGRPTVAGVADVPARRVIVIP